MIQTSARLLQLLSLLQVRREWTGPALADRMGVTERTVRRDIDKLRNLGYPIHASPGIAGSYQSLGGRRPALVPGGLGYRSRRLADLQGGPDGLAAH